MKFPEIFKKAKTYSIIIITITVGFGMYVFFNLPQENSWMWLKLFSLLWGVGFLSGFLFGTKD